MRCMSASRSMAVTSAERPLRLSAMRTRKLARERQKEKNCMGETLGDEEAHSLRSERHARQLMHHHELFCVPWHGACAPLPPFAKRMAGRGRGWGAVALQRTAVFAMLATTMTEQTRTRPSCGAPHPRPLPATRFARGRAGGSRRVAGAQRLE